MIFLDFIVASLIEFTILYKTNQRILEKTKPGGDSQAKKHQLSKKQLTYGNYNGTAVAPYGRRNRKLPVKPQQQFPPPDQYIHQRIKSFQKTVTKKICMIFGK